MDTKAAGILGVCILVAALVLALISEEPANTVIARTTAKLAPMASADG